MDFDRGKGGTSKELLSRKITGQRLESRVIEQSTMYQHTCTCPTRIN